MRVHRLGRVEGDWRVPVTRNVASEIHILRLGSHRPDGRRHTRSTGRSCRKREDSVAMMNLLEMRKYAICRRVEIRFGNSISQECLINNKGQVKIPGEGKDFRVEDILDAAEKFVIVGNEN